jgi:diacylglycerol O-acyltransferase
VVLAVVADATGRYLRSRGARTDKLWLRAMVPVSTREKSGAHALGNRVVSVFVDLPMFELDPVERLRICHDAMAEVKSSHHAVGAEFLVGLGQFAPPTIHAMASRVASRSRLYNFLVTNVPGPQVPIYCLGARLLGFFPFTPLAATQSYAVGLTSIDGWLNFGFTADYDAIPDVERITGYLLDAVVELRRSADAVDVRGELVRQSRRRPQPPAEGTADA